MELGIAAQRTRKGGCVTTAAGEGEFSIEVAFEALEVSGVSEKRKGTDIGKRCACGDLRDIFGIVGGNIDRSRAAVKTSRRDVESGVAILDGQGRVGGAGVKIAIADTFGGEPD